LLSNQKLEIAPRDIFAESSLVKKVKFPHYRAELA
jgi:hypothetical protein